MRHAIIDQSNKVVNIIIWPNGSFNVPAGYQSIESDTAQIGDIYQDGQFIEQH